MVGGWSDVQQPRLNICPAITAIVDFHFFRSHRAIAMSGASATSIRGRFAQASAFRKTISIARTTSGSVSFGSRGLGRIRSSHCLESDCCFTGGGSEQRHDDDDDSEALAPSITRTRSHLATMEMVLRRALRFWLQHIE